jgi:H+/Cl- antiporter ClcA
MIEIPIFLLYIIDGLIGAAIWILTPPHQLEKKEIIKRLFEGAIIGYIVYVLGLPNHITALTAGYTGIDFIKQLLESIKKKGEVEK